MRRAKRHASRNSRLTFQLRAGSAAMTQDTFISHLMELRDRLLRCLIAIAVVYVVNGR